MTANVEIEEVTLQPSTVTIGQSFLVTATIIDLDIANYPYNYPYNYQRDSED